jgi:hypothetical protein
MKLNRTAQVTSRDNHRAWFIRQGGIRRRVLCAECDELIQLLTLEEAAVAANVEPQTIYTLIESGKLHGVRTDEAISLICLNSLIKFRVNSERPEE